MKNQIKGLRKLSTEEMEKVSGGCPGVQNFLELLTVLAWLDDNGHRAQADIISAGFANGTLQYSPGCN